MGIGFRDSCAHFCVAGTEENWRTKTYRQMYNLLCFAATQVLNFLSAFSRKGIFLYYIFILSLSFVCNPLFYLPSLSWSFLLPRSYSLYQSGAHCSVVCLTQRVDALVYSVFENTMRSAYMGRGFVLQKCTI